MSDVAENDAPVRETVASLGRRVERLEVLATDMRRQVDHLDNKFDSMNALFEVKFTTLSTQQVENTRKLDAFISKVDNLIMDSMKQAGDIDATPLGRMVNKRLTDLESTTETNTQFRESARGLGYIISAYLLPAVAVLISITTAVAVLTRGS